MKTPEEKLIDQYLDSKEAQEEEDFRQSLEMQGVSRELQREIEDATDPGETVEYFAEEHNNLPVCPRQKTAKHPVIFSATGHYCTKCKRRVI